MNGDYMIQIFTPMVSVNVMISDIDEIYDIVDAFIDYNFINPIYQPRYHYDKVGNFKRMDLNGKYN